MKTCGASLFVGTLLLGSLSPVLGTEVLVFFTKDFTVIATDSLIVVPGGTNYKRCKLRQLGDVFWAAAGLDSDSGSGYSVDDFFTANLFKDARLPDALDAVGKNLVEPLQKELPSIKTQAPDYHARLLRDRNFLSLYAVRIRDGSVETYGKDIKLVNGSVVPKDSTTCVAPCILMPEVPEVQQYFAAHPEIWEGDVVKAVDALMEVAYKADPDYIGPPYSILVVSLSRGIHWLRQNDCPALKQQSEKKALVC